MKKFEVVVVEEVERRIVVEANNESEAEEMVMDVFQSTGELGEGSTESCNTEVFVRGVDTVLTVVWEGVEDTWVAFEAAESHYVNCVCAESDKKVKDAYMEICKAIIERKNITGDGYEVRISPAHIKKMMTPEGVELPVRDMDSYPTDDAVILNRKWVYAGGEGENPTHELNFVVEMEWLENIYKSLWVDTILDEFLIEYEPETDGEALYQKAKESGAIMDEYFIQTAEFQQRLSK